MTQNVLLFLWKEGLRLDYEYKICLSTKSDLEFECYCEKYIICLALPISFRLCFIYISFSKTSETKCLVQKRIVQTPGIIFFMNKTFSPGYSSITLPRIWIDIPHRIQGIFPTGNPQEDPFKLFYFLLKYTFHLHFQLLAYFSPSLLLARILSHLQEP